MHGLILLSFAGAVLAMSAAAVHDLMVRTVPNRLAALAALCGLALAAAQDRLSHSLIVAAIVLAGAVVLWLRGWMGGGDAKLLGAAGLLAAPGMVMPMLLVIALAGGVLCLPYLPGKRLFPRPAAQRPATLAGRVIRCEQWRLRRRGPLPYAVAIATGALFALLHGA